MRLVGWLAVLQVVLILCSGNAVRAGESRPGVLVELYTSQGCSSCPPADRLLGELPQQLRGDLGVEVIPLSFHVDYWNRLGWTDPFSDPAFSERQRRYARWMKEGRVFTPQLVISGREQCVGSQASCIRDAVRAEDRGSKGESAHIQIAAVRDVSSRVIKVELAVTGNRSRRSQTLFLAARQRQLVTEVRSGENARRTLHNDFVVRYLVDAGTVADGESSATFEVVVVPAPEWAHSDLDWVAFLQDMKTGQVSSAVWID